MVGAVQSASLFYDVIRRASALPWEQYNKQRPHLSTNFVQFSSVQGMRRARTVPKDVHINNYDQFSSVQLSANHAIPYQTNDEREPTHALMRGNLPMR